MKDDFSVIENDIFELKEMFKDIKKDWAECAYDGFQFKNINSFINEVDDFQ